MKNQGFRSGCAKRYRSISSYLDNIETIYAPQERNTKQQKANKEQIKNIGAAGMRKYGARSNRKKYHLSVDIVPYLCYNMDMRQ